jgi:nicotinamidase-related amidase
MGAKQSRALNSTASHASLGRLSDADTALFVCDVQDRFRSVIHGYPAVVDVANRMARAAGELDLPCVVTEQYPKALGHTVSEVAEVLPESSLVVSKTDFSMVVPEVKEFLEKNARVRNVVILGVETHVCVLQTAIDLCDLGYKVHILADGVSSQRLGDRAAALHRLAGMSPGQVFIASSEMALFQMMVNTSHPKFKAISGICKGERPEPLPNM